MTLASTSRVLRMTGLSAATLREWTSRRALIPADVRPQKKGSPAQYSWQTVLILRLAVALRNQFHVELKAQKSLFDELRAALSQSAFADLFGKRLAVTSGGAWSLTKGQTPDFPDDVILIHLDPHLRAIEAEFQSVKSAERAPESELPHARRRRTR